MANITSSLTIKLIDDVSGPAKKVAEALKLAERQAKEIGKALEQAGAWLATILAGGKIELKSETWQWEQTGNICIEYLCDGNPSWIAVTEADVWVHELRRDNEPLVYLMFPIERLKALAREAIRRGGSRVGGHGLSKRQAAKLLGVDEKQIRRDICVRTKAAESADKSRTEKPALSIVPERERYETIVIDPPWPMTKIERDVRPNQIEFDYPTMSEDELQEFGADVHAMAKDDCHLFMWTTQKFLPLAMRLIEQYGFRYVLTMVWHKPGGYQPTGLPQFNCEFIIYGRKGTPKFIDTKGFPCCFNAPRREHSRKPDEFYDIVSLVTEGPRIDVFSREPREGFSQFGNEPEKFVVA
jgi:Transcriptional activator, adenine-specific DNA methyltransferase